MQGQSEVAPNAEKLRTSREKPRAIMKLWTNNNDDRRPTSFSSFYGQMQYQQLLATRFTLERDWQRIARNWIKKRTFFYQFVKVNREDRKRVAEKKINIRI